MEVPVSWDKQINHCVLIECWFCSPWANTEWTMNNSENNVQSIWCVEAHHVLTSRINMSDALQSQSEILPFPSCTKLTSWTQDCQCWGFKQTALTILWGLWKSVFSDWENVQHLPVQWQGACHQLHQHQCPGLNPLQGHCQLLHHYHDYVQEGE